jgi:hypothetical protein
MEECFYLRVEGSGDFGLGNKADAIMKIYKDENRWKEEIVSDEDDILSCLNKSSSRFMGYLSKQDIISYIKDDSRGRFWSVKEVSESEANEFLFADEDES